MQLRWGLERNRFVRCRERESEIVDFIHYVSGNVILLLCSL